MPVKVRLNRYKCIGCGYCIAIAPELWVISTIDGKITTVSSPETEEDNLTLVLEKEQELLVNQSVKICPTKVFLVYK
jgi:ferredoxin